MSILDSVHLISQITHKSKPRISEIVELFDGLRVDRSLRNFSRVIYNKHIATPLGIGTKPSRFGSYVRLRGSEGQTFIRVLYGAEGVDTAIYETIVRNKFDINPNRVLYPVNYQEMIAVRFSSDGANLLKLLDLTKGKATCYGVPTDVIRSSDHTEGQHFSQFVYENMHDIDGFIYSSRFTEQDCVALYHNRVINKLHSDKQFELQQSSVSIALSSKNIEVL